MGLISLQLDLAFVLARRWGRLNIKGCGPTIRPLLAAARLLTIVKF